MVVNRGGETTFKHRKALDDQTLSLFDVLVLNRAVALLHMHFRCLGPINATSLQHAQTQNDFVETFVKRRHIIPQNSW